MVEDPGLAPARQPGRGGGFCVGDARFKSMAVALLDFLREPRTAREPVLWPIAAGLKQRGKPIARSVLPAVRAKRVLRHEVCSTHSPVIQTPREKLLFGVVGHFGFCRQE